MVWKQNGRVRPGAVWVMLAAVIVVAIAIGADRRPADPSRPLCSLGTPREDSIPGRTLRVATFNIHGGKGRDGRCDLARIAELLDSFRLVGLNEVRSGWLQPDASQVHTLGRQLDMLSVFAPTERRWWHDAFGNGILSSVALRSVHPIPFPGTQGKKYRNAVLVSLDVGNEPVRVIVTHLDTRQDRIAQLEESIDLFLALREPAILMGDLNTSANDSLLRDLLRTPGVVDAVDPNGRDRGSSRRIDWILVRGLQSRDSGCIDTGASDHPLVWAELELPVRNNLVGRLPQQGRSL